MAASLLTAAEKRRPWLLLSPTLAALVALPVSAQHGPGSGPPDFAEFDLNADGILNEAEFYEARGRRIAERAAEGRPMKHLGDAPDFSDIDLDGSGTVDVAEFSEHQARHREQRMQQRPE